MPNEQKFIFIPSDIKLFSIDFSTWSDAELNLLSEALLIENIESGKPLGKNSVRSIAVLFEDRRYYDELVAPTIKNTSPNKVFANLYEENALYGLVDRDLNAIYPLEEHLKNIPSVSREPKYVMDFVADAFNQMNAYLGIAAMKGKIDKNGPFFNLKAHLAYVPPDLITKAVETNYLESFKVFIGQQKDLAAKIKDAGSFNKQFINFIKLRLRNNYPITKTAVIFATSFSAHVNGLTITIGKDKADNDTIKFDKYWNHRDFLCFADICKRFGFKIDINVPWRIMADLNSPAMLERVGDHTGYMLRYNLRGIDDLFESRYRRARDSELEYLKTLFHNVYSKYVNEWFSYEADYKKLDVCDFREQTVFIRPKYTRQQYVDLFPDTYWLRVYTYLRNYEERRNFTQQEFENVVREGNNFVRVFRNNEALKFINDYFKQFREVRYFSSLQTKEDEVEQSVGSLIDYDLVL